MKEIKPGTYLAYDFRGAFGHSIGAVLVDEKLAVEPAHVEAGRSTTLEGMLSGREGTPYREKRPDRVWLHEASAVLPLKDLRVPDAEGQEALRACDDEITKLEGDIQKLRQRKQEYIVEKRLEWDIPSWDDFRGFKGWKEGA
ncbi:MAG: hypothetical protein JRN45_00690 [Nitrososphaerota archaeon]|nr:hypothetical protein [Nitrososphaerota archaeon]